MRSDDGVVVLDKNGGLVSAIEREGQVAAQPTFSREGDLALSWEDESVEWYRKDGGKMRDDTFYGDLFGFSRDGRYLAASDGISKLRIWDEQGKVVADFPLSAPANEICFGPDGDLVVCATRDGLVYGYSTADKRPAWPPIQLEKAARWIYVQDNGQIVTMSDIVTVWKQPEPLDRSLRDPEALSREVARRTGWIYDDRNAQVRTLSRDEYLELFP